MNKGLYAWAGAWATAKEAAWAIWLLFPTTKVSNVLRGLREPWEAARSSYRTARRAGGALFVREPNESLLLLAELKGGWEAIPRSTFLSLTAICLPVLRRSRWTIRSR